MKKTAFFCILMYMTIGFSFASDTNSSPIERMEPPCWWTGMETPLQLMLYGKDIAAGQVVCLTSGMEVVALHRGDSPNYLFVDLSISEKAGAGVYELQWTSGKKKVTISYALHERQALSKEREGLSPADVVYLLMPDRYLNGDKANDNSPLTAEEAAYDKDYGRHGGDLAGIDKSLDYLQELGVTAIWPTPVTLDNEPTVSYHGYACADYYLIDPRFGTNLQYRDLVNKAGRAGIKFIQDIVPNHCGTAHWWMKDLPFKDWINTFSEYTRSNFAMSTHMDPYAAKADRDLCVKGWFDTSMADMNLTNPFVLHYFIQATVWWMEYAGLAGVRIDTYPYSDETAISSYTAALRKEYPNATVVAECWFHEPHQVAYWERGPWPSGPTVMDFPMQDELCRALTEDRSPEWGRGVTRLYNVLANDYVYKNPNELLIFAENHDTNRMFEMLGRNPEKLKMAYTFLATTRGIPQIYYGSEILLCAADPANLGHGPERRDMPARVLVKEGRDPIEQNVYDYISKLLQWRKTSEAVHSGKLLHYLPKYEENMYVYFRILPNERVMVLINNGMDPVKIDWERYAQGLGNAVKGKEVMSGMEITVGQPAEVPAQTAIFFTFAGL
ncbi:MAG TPA: alpha-amylase family glycosyl hydrolase [Bacteroidales bacterium]|nr:alpha-amylase family glycosyl hydrolase [Bacteroidales bacterium]